MNVDNFKIISAKEQQLAAQMLLIRTVLGLSPIHDPVEAVRVLHEQGRDAFEKARGPVCDYAHQWKP